jgi:hypothetical protein
VFRLPVAERGAETVSGVCARAEPAQGPLEARIRQRPTGPRSREHGGLLRPPLRLLVAQDSDGRIRQRNVVFDADLHPLARHDPELRGGAVAGSSFASAERVEARAAGAAD